MPSVLIVDDEPMICKYLSNRYKREGYETLTATNVKDALLICKSNNPDVVITDMKMPEINGADLIHDLKNFINYNPVIVCITGYHDISSKDINDMGGDALFNKPFKIGEIINATKMFLQNKLVPNHYKEKLFDKKSVIALGNEAFANEHHYLISELSAGIIHNINNHIAFISTSSYILKKQIEDELEEDPTNDLKQKNLKIADKINSHSLTVAKIIKSIKMLAYPNNRNLNKENISILSILENTLYLLEDTLKMNQIKCKIFCDKDIELSCYPEYLIQVFICLIKNSFEAITEMNTDDKWINIEVFKYQDRIDISFTDCGNGVDINFIPYLMKPFQTTKSRFNGIGLGLSICKRLMEIHNGSISLDETSKNTRFVLSFNVI